MSELPGCQHLAVEPESQKRFSSNFLNHQLSEELTRLIENLLEYRREHGFGSEQSESAKAALCCRALMVGVSDLGLENIHSPERDDVLGSLKAECHEGFPELRVCRLWLESASGRAGREAAEQFADLGKSPMWAPVQVLVYRALAHFGRRQLLAELLSECPSPSLLHMDVWMEASSPSDPWENGMNRFQNSSAELLPANLQEDWRRLLGIELALALAQPSEEDRAFLEDQVKRDLPPAPHGYVGGETCRFLARASSALVRVQLAMGREVESALSIPAARSLPVWERRFLEGLSSWQIRRTSEAMALLNSR